MTISRLTAAVTAAAAVVLAAGGVSSAAEAQVPAARPAAGGSMTAQPSSGQVVLINGDRVGVRGTASGVLAAVARTAPTGLAGSLIRLHIGGQAYVIPAAAFPYLNRGLSPSLFELSALLGHEPGGRLPVQLNYRGRLHGLPGVTITRSGGGTARGYLTAASGRVFGAALARQMIADHSRGSYGTDGMFADGTSIALAGAATAAPARPDYPMHTLTVTGTDEAGQPDTGDAVNVFNVDNLLRFGFIDGGSIFYQGSARFSVPAGHYMALGIFFDISGQTLTGWRIVTLPQFTVTGTQAVGLDERTATSEVRMLTPRPVVTRDVTLSIDRADADGNVLDESIDAANVPLRTNVTSQPVTVGTLQAITTGYLTSPAAAARYEYDLDFTSPSGLIGSQRHVVTAGSVATVAARYVQGAASTGGWLPVGLFLSQAAGFFGGDIYPFRLPQAETQYLSAAPSLVWLSQYWQSYAVLAGGQADSPRSFSPGEHTALDWNGFPLRPGYDTSLLGPAGPFPALPSASRAGNTLTLTITPFTDNTPGHAGAGFATGIFGSLGRVTGSYLLYQNGTKIAGGNAARAAGGAASLELQARLSGKPSTVRFVLSAARTGSPLYELSSSSQTAWTWRTSRPSGARLPPGWICATGYRSCTVQPMLALSYQVAGLAVNGSAPAGPQAIRLSVGHLQLARAARITRATVQVSVDNGRTWRSALVVPLGGGQFEVTFPAAAGDYVTLRTTAADAAGGPVTETIARGYKIAS